MTYRTSTTELSLNFSKAEGYFFTCYNYPMPKFFAALTTPISFIREVLVELHLVKWPTRHETVRLTAIVVAVTLLMSAYIGGLDFAFTSLLTSILR